MKSTTTPIFLVLMFLSFMRAAAADVWVDVNGTGDGSSDVSPTSDWIAAISNATEGATVHIKGGGGRVYSITTVGTQIPVKAPNVTLAAWGDEKPVFSMANNVTHQTSSPSVFQINASGVTLENLRFEVGATTYGYGTRGFDLSDVVGGRPNYIPTNITFRACEFVANEGLDPGNRGCLFTAGNQNDTAASGLRVEDCFFANFKGTFFGESTIFRLSVASPVFSGNVFTNCAVILMSNGNDSLKGMEFCSNIVMSSAQSRISYREPGISVGYSSGQNSKIHHNVFINPNTSPRVAVCSARGSEYGAYFNSEFYNNTLVNYGTLLWLGESTVNYQNHFPVKVYNNLLVETDLDATPYGLISNASSNLCYQATTEAKNNVVVGTASLNYDAIEPTRPPNYVVQDNHALGTAPDPVVFRSMDMSRWLSPKFLQPDAACAEEIRRGGIGGDYPVYIGAVEPYAPSGTLLSLR